MLSYTPVAAIFAFLGVAAAANIPRAACSTTDTGYPVIYVGNTDGHLEGLRLNAKEQLTFGNGTGHYFKAHFQSCPDVTGDGEFNSYGRILIEPSAANKCLTISNPNDATGPYYAKSAECTSNTKPSVAQTFGFGNDFGDVVFWANSCDAGIAVNDDTGYPDLGSDGRIKFICSGDESYESFTFNASPYVANP